MRKICKLVISLIVTSVLMSPIVAMDNQSIDNPAIYRVLIDQNYGFYRIYEMHDNVPNTDITDIYSKNGTLNISKGDTMIFVSDTMPDRLLTIISKEKLWTDKNGTLKYSGKEFSYTFNKSGIYNIHIKGKPQLRQKIVVGSMDIGYIDTIDANDTVTIDNNDTELNQTNDTGTTDTNDIELNQTNDTGTIDTNDTEPNKTNDPGQNNTTVVSQNSIISKSSVLVRTEVLLIILILSVIYLLSVKIKE